MQVWQRLGEVQTARPLPYYSIRILSSYRSLESWTLMIRRIKECVQAFDLHQDLSIIGPTFKRTTMPSGLSLGCLWGSWRDRTTTGYGPSCFNGAPGQGRVSVVHFDSPRSSHTYHHSYKRPRYDMSVSSKSLHGNNCPPPPRSKLVIRDGPADRLLPCNVVNSSRG